ncbi:MAG: fold metallo-hydrolase [Conexibacter sp.]|nr:fold metallo-hydrolase [Conexibacter sp.]
MFTVGPVQENSFLIRRDGGDRALLVDPGEEAPKLLGAIKALGVQLDAILLTHCHFDHVGAVAPVAKATGAPVYCPQIEVPILQDIMAYVPWAGFGPFESWDPEHTVAGGERLSLAGYDIDVLFTPGHSPGHVTYAIADGDEPTALFSGDRIADATGDRSPVALFSGDVLFQSSIGRTDLPGGDHATLLASIATLMERFDDDAVVHPGHMGLTTLGAERAGNPFLSELSQPS